MSPRWGFIGRYQYEEARDLSRGPAPLPEEAYRRDGLGYSQYIDIPRIFQDECSTPGGPVVRWPQGPAVSKGARFALDEWPQLNDQGDPARDWVLIGAANTLKELSSLQEALYVYQENLLRRY